ncbi:MAG TPA: Crp/Fnr family transcriptional regulator [Thermoanaerobaculia bacterium]
MNEADFNDVTALLAANPLRDSGALLRRFERRVVRQGSVFVVEGDRGRGLAVVAEGSIRATRRVSDERELTVFMLKRGDVFGFLPLLDGGACPLTLSGETDAVVYLLDRRLFQDFLQQNAPFAANLLAYIAERFRECIDQLGMLGKPGAVARLAAALVGQLPADAQSGVIIEWPMRQTSLAGALGIAPENLSRAVSRLQHMGIIHRTTGHRLRIVDPVRLRAAAERSLPGLDDRQ